MDLLLLSVLLGLVVGAVMGALGGGGGIIAVPALVYLLHQPPAVATTTSMVVVGITAVVSTLQQARAGRVAWDDGMTFGLLGAGGALLGAHLGAGADPQLTMGLFSGLLVLVSVLMLRRARRGRGDDAHVEPWLTWRPFRVRPGRAVVVVLAASLVGLLTGFFGVGGGFAIVPALTLVLGMPMPRAVGTSLLVIAINSAVGLAGRVGSELHLDWRMIAAFTAAAVTASLVGGRFVRRVDPAALQQAFAVLLLVVAAWTALRTFVL